MTARYTQAELALRRELKAQLEAAQSEVEKASLRNRLQRVRDGASERAKKRADREADSAAPKREDFASDETFRAELDRYRLDLTKRAAERVLNSGKAGLRARIQADKTLDKISKRRRELSPEDYAEPASILAASAPEPPNPSTMSDQRLREKFAVEKMFGWSPELIAELEIEIRRRKMLLVWRVEGCDNLYVNERGEQVSEMNKPLPAGTVYMGEVPTPHPPPKEDEKNPTPYNASPEAPQPDPPKSLDFAYRLFDGLTFWPWLEIQVGPLPRETHVLSAPNPPGYVHGSDKLPEGYVFDVTYFVWKEA